MFVIKNSLRCYIIGWFGMVPILGIIPAIVAIILYKKVQIESGEGWNPARPHLLCGCILSWFGLSLSAGLLAVALLVVTRSLIE